MEPRQLEHHDSYISPEDLPINMAAEEFQRAAAIDKDDAVREWLDSLQTEKQD